MTSLQSLVLEYKNVGSEAIKAKIVKESEALVKSIVSKSQTLFLLHKKI